MKTKRARLKYKIDTGDTGTKPVLEIIDCGQTTYLWIGDNDTYGKRCFATLCGEKTLRRLAESILTCLSRK